MKSKVIIEKEEITIVLTPENVFEENIIENASNVSSKYNISTVCKAIPGMGGYSNHKIEVKMTKKESNT